MNEKATFAAGCFWGVQATFDKIDGVLETIVGYTGGKLPAGRKNPGYEEVCSGKSGYAESLQVTFDPKKVSYKDLLNVFWENHDPTQKNRQGADVGSQYRSAVFYHTEKQKEAVEKSRTQLEKSGRYAYPIVTEITLAQTFYKAEDYHQKYLEKNGKVCHA